MTTFEDGFAAAEKAADSVLTALKSYSLLAAQLRKAARDGNIAAVRRTSQQLQNRIGLIQQEVANAAGAWPFAPEAERDYLESQYSEELKEEAGKKGLQVFDRDGRLIVHPSVVRVMPGDRAVELNRRRTSAIRPSKIMADLEKLQKSPSRSNPQQTLERLYRTYLGLLARSDIADRLRLGEVGQVIQLSLIYDMWTGGPGSGRDYSQLDFARDLYNLETSGVRQVRAGPRVSFPASTGTRNPRATFSFVGPDGEPSCTTAFNSQDSSNDQFLVDFRVA